MLREENTGIKDRFFEDISREYQVEWTDSFLYKYYEEESLENAITNEREWQKLLAEDRKAAREALLKDPNENKSSNAEKTNRRRSDFFEELWLNDAGLKKGLITERDYYIWLVEYLKSHDTYYKDGGIVDRSGCLENLLVCALPEEERKGPVRQQLRRTGSQGKNNILVAECLERLSAMLKGKPAREADKVLKPLYRLGGGIYAKGYLLYLTEELRVIAVHSKVKTFLQNSGYPLRLKNSRRKEKSDDRKERSQNYTMNLFDAYCRSEKGYDFIRKTSSSGLLAGNSAERHYDMDSRFYYLVDGADRTGEIALLEECIRHRQEKEEADGLGDLQLFIPLAVDAVSGCIFALVGKGNYEKMYRDTKEKIESKYRSLSDRDKKSSKGQHWVKCLKEIQEYEESGQCCCFDYLHLDTEKFQNVPHRPGAAYRLYPRFHKNAGKSYTEVLGEFKRYCILKEGFAAYAKESLPGWMLPVVKRGADEEEETEIMTSPRETVRTMNLERPEGVPGIFYDFFCEPDEEEEERFTVNEEARKAFLKAKSRAEKELAQGMIGNRKP